MCVIETVSIGTGRWKQADDKLVFLRHILQTEPKPIKISTVKETAVPCFFTCHLFFKILGIILDDITLQLTGSKHYYFRTVDSFSTEIL